MRCDVWSAQWEGPLGQWLRGQLDARGIDAPAYGRYVLSLLTRPLQPDDLSPETVQTWERKRKWAPVKIETLKRSAAVQCLMNASDEQSSSIEQLVDELCKKIKEVEEKKNGKRGTQSTRASRRDRTRTASPREMARLYYAAFPALGPAGKENLPQPCTQWPARERRNTFHSQRPAPRQRQRRDRSARTRRRQPLPEWVTHSTTWDMDGQDPIEDFIKSVTVDEGYGTCDNTAMDDFVGSKRLYERDSDSSLRKNTDDMILTKNWIIDDDLGPPPRSPAEEESIAKFEAKFDRSLEALWPKEQNNTPDDEYQELPVDFQDLLSSPSDKMFDCSSSPDKPLPMSLTGSIWSNNESNLECDPNECVFHRDHFTPRMFVSNLGLNCYPSNQKNLWQNYSESYSKESMEVIYNKLQPLNLDDTEESPNSNENTLIFGEAKPVIAQAERWPEEFDTDPYSLHCYNDVLDSVPAATTAIRSLTALNHNRLYSSFTEVIPKSAAGFVGDGIKRKNNDTFKMEVSKPIKSSLSVEKEDEDLLTSMRTHFKPIKHDSEDSAHAIVNYADGVTFPIISDLDDVKFTRSDSGTMYLESDTEPPKQYMEYRKQGIDYSRLDILPSANCSDDGLSSNDLVLKFRVYQNEKSVQTDDLNVDLKVGTSPKVDSCSSLQATSPECSIVSLDGEEKSGANLDTDSELESLQLNWIQCDECKTNSNPWVTNQSSWHPTRYNSTKIWSLDDKFCKACNDQRAEAKAKRHDSQKALVCKEETAREWDELLSDITYVQSLQSENDWQDESDTPDDVCYIAPKEISVCASDGNFIKSALLARLGGSEWGGKVGANVVGSILDRSLSLYSAVEAQCEEERAWGRGEGGRKRRHSAGGARGAGKLRCPLPPAPPPLIAPLIAPLLAHADRPLTR